MVRRFDALAALCTLAACIQSDDAVELPDNCGISDYEYLLGQDRSALDGIVFPNPTRILSDGDAMTMDYREDRLNIALDKEDRVTRIWCG